MKTPDTGQTIKTSRIIVRNLPKHCTEAGLREWVSKHAKLPITDARVPRNSAGESRRIGFVGFQSDQDAANALEKLNRVFFDTSRVSVGPAFPPGSKNLPRPWSRHAPGSSAYERFQQKKETQKKEKQERKAAIAEKRKKEEEKEQPQPDTSSREAFLKQQFLLVQTKRKGHNTWCDDGVIHPEQRTTKRPRCLVSNEIVKPTKAGVSVVRQHVEFDDQESVEQNSNTENSDDDDITPQKTSVKVDSCDALSDTQAMDDPLEWLRQKAVEESVLPEAGKAGVECDIGSGSPNATLTIKASCARRLESKSNGTELNVASDTPSSVSPAIEMTATERQDDVIGDTGRLLVLNLPYSVEESELKSHFSVYGEVSQVHICRDENRLNSCGRAFVQFAFPEHAVQAASELHMSLFQGRIIRIKGALFLPVRSEAVGKIAGRLKHATSSYKRRLEEKLKKNAENPRTWNLLYVSANSAMESAASELGIEKRDLMSVDGDQLDSIAARVALGETHVIQQTKRWLEDEGIDASAFDRQGVSLLQSRIADCSLNQERSNDAIIVKHLPPMVTQNELFRLFSASGPLVRCCLSPSKTVAVVQFMEPAHAKRAFQRLAFSRIKNVPLFLEWAPKPVFCRSKPTVAILGDSSTPPSNKDPSEEAKPEHTGAPTSSRSDTERLKELLDLEAEADTSVHVSLFVKNLNFNTSEETLTDLFSSSSGFVKATIMRKSQAVKQSAKSLPPEQKAPALSMGYGFVEFRSASAAMEALKRFQGKTVDGHVIELKVSERLPSSGTSNEQNLTSTVDLSKLTQKLTVRNLAFQATKKDLRRLFAAFGNVVAVRIPKKPDGTSRGYGFVEYLSKSEALSALEALQHTHLYGRKLVLEPADETETTVDSVRAKQAVQVLSKAKVTESSSRKRMTLLDDVDSHKFDALL